MKKLCLIGIALIFFMAITIPCYGLGTPIWWLDILGDPGNSPALASYVHGKGYLGIPADNWLREDPAIFVKKSGDNFFDYFEFSSTSTWIAYFLWISPDDWDLGTIKMKFTGAAGEAMTNNDTVTVGVACTAVSSGDTLSFSNTTGRQTATWTYSTGDETDPIQRTTSATAALTVKGTPATGDYVYCLVDAASTHSKKVWLTGVRVEYGRTAPTPW